MNHAGLPPPLPPLRRLAPARWGLRIAIVAAVLGVFVFLGFCALIALRVGGMIVPYKIPTANMAPAINRDDQIFMEGITYRFRPPARGEIIVFEADALPNTKPGERYVKRLVGLPGDRLRISGGTLYINDQPSPLRNKAGEMHYTTGMGTYLRDDGDTFTVPYGKYFVLGDNSPNSADSRMWGAIPTGWVTGRAVYCYRPSRNAGWLR